MNQFHFKGNKSLEAAASAAKTPLQRFFGEDLDLENVLRLRLQIGLNMTDLETLAEKKILRFSWICLMWNLKKTKECFCWVDSI